MIKIDFKRFSYKPALNFDTLYMMSEKIRDDVNITKGEKVDLGYIFLVANPLEIENIKKDLFSYWEDDEIYAIKGRVGTLGNCMIIEDVNANGITLFTNAEDLSIYGLYDFNIPNTKTKKPNVIHKYVV